MPPSCSAEQEGPRPRIQQPYEAQAQCITERDCSCPWLLAGSKGVAWQQDSQDRATFTHKGCHVFCDTCNSYVDKERMEQYADQDCEVSD